MLGERPFLLLDGGLATELERRGHDLNHALWSARLLLTDPRAIGQVHDDYLAAGAECLISASYQASLPGLIREGLSQQQAAGVLRLSVEIAREARDRHAEQHGGRAWVAASVGPYGAALADGSEYAGDYRLSAEELREFHQPRWEILCNAGADLLACETIPSLVEAEVLRELLDQSPGCRAWVSFSCRDQQRISDGTPLARCAALFNDCPQVIAIGANCTAPQYISNLIGCVQQGAPSKRVVVYPNSGRTYDPALRRWTGPPEEGLPNLARQWLHQGATLIGGCCGTQPRDIQDIRAALAASRPSPLNSNTPASDRDESTQHSSCRIEDESNHGQRGNDDWPPFHRDEE
jgi:homocysteine S-methyltransferase